MASKVPVEISPVSMIAGIWRPSCLAQFGDDLDPVHSIGKIVIRQNEVRLERTSRRQFQCSDTVGRRHHLMALGLEHQFKEFAYIRIVLDNQDRSGPVTIRNPLLSAVTSAKC